MEYTFAKAHLESWHVLCFTHLDAMYGAAFKVLHNPDDAKDAVQEALCAVLETEFADHISNPRAYLAQTARNKAIDIVRKNKYIDIRPLDENDFTNDLDLQDQVVRQIGLEFVITLIDQLPEKHKYALTQRWLAERPAKEVATELGVTAQRVSQIVNEGLAMFRKLSPYIPSDQEHSSSRPPTTDKTN